MFFSPRVFGVLCLLCLPGASLAQEDTQLEETNVVVATKQGTALNVTLTNADAVKALSTIATRGNLSLIIKSGAVGVPVSMLLQNQSPESALQKVCEAAKLSLEQKHEIWIVSPQQTQVAASPIVDAMEFRNTTFLKILDFLAMRFDVPIVVTENVQGEIPFIRLSSTTVSDALKAICLACDANVEQQADGTFLVSMNTQELASPNGK